jgi:pilus assembly protein CpaB
MRAVTIPVSARTAVAGFVFPGDHIDLVLTQTVKGTMGQSLKTSETILKNLRVLATDQSTEQESVEGKTRVRTFSTVTLEVTPKLAEKIAVAQTIGTISLSLRSIADNSTELEQALASGDVKIPAGTSKADEEKIIKQAMGKPIDSATSFVTGGDVSRFQRKSMPLLGDAAPAPAPAPMQAMAPRPVASGPITISKGPIVRVTRGKQTEDVSVGGL